MPRYIDKDEALKKLSWDTDAYQTINMMPTADVVPVVRCKDCKHFDQAEKYCCDFLTADEDGFCKWGKRREDGEIH